MPAFVKRFDIIDEGYVVQIAPGILTAMEEPLLGVVKFHVC